MKYIYYILSLTPFITPTHSLLKEVIQASTPPRIDLQTPKCHQTLFTHSFSNSYGSPYIGIYTPPPPEKCTYDTTIFNLSIVSQGRQYDRLATLWLDDVEIWRTSTAMPTQEGITWSFQKDVTIWDVLLRDQKKKRKIIFELNNVVDGDRYTGIFNVTLEALYFSDGYGGLTPADMIYPLSTQSASSNKTSLFSLPGDDAAVDIVLPRNAKTAVVSVMASGNAEEEFWFTNVPTGYIGTFPGNEGWLYGYSPFREVQLRIDGELAGVSWPFPILFTGGVDPGAWRPVVGIDAFELPSFEIDVTPWLGILTDGEAHRFELGVVGYDGLADDGIGTVGENWWVSGSVFVWVDGESEQTTAKGLEIDAPSPLFHFQPTLGTFTTDNGSVTNTSFYFSLNATRSLKISSIITTGGKDRQVAWEQDVFYSNIQNMTDYAFNQSLAMVSSGSYSSSASNIVSTYTYPMNLFSAYKVQSEGATSNPGSVLCLVDKSKLTDGIALLPYLTGISTGRGTLSTRQNVTSDYHWNRTIVQGTPGLDKMDGEMWFSSSNSPGSKAGVTKYHHYAKDKDDVLIVDREGWSTIRVPPTEPLPIVEGEPKV
ncbi:peptide N-acetyl-beta-D-glucosaminyl asparaginase amidase A-domain-containing protein [Poronia punctata]|nr:peptide N-acetyl-beta-D-glucosaminyl asparaginase amidase A-domain-containing protein [Poronia punctata]